MKRTISALNKAIAAQEKALEILKAELQKLEADTGAVGTAPVASKKPRQEKTEAVPAEGRQPRKSRAERAAEKEAAATKGADKRPQKQAGDDVKSSKKKKA